MWRNHLSPSQLAEAGGIFLKGQGEMEASSARRVRVYL